MLIHCTGKSALYNRFYLAESIDIRTEGSARQIRYYLRSRSGLGLGLSGN